MSLEEVKNWERLERGPKVRRPRYVSRMPGGAGEGTREAPLYPGVRQAWRAVEGTDAANPEAKAIGRSGLGGAISPEALVTGTPSQTARVSTVRWNLNSIYAIASVDLASKGDEFARDQTVKANEKWSRALVEMWMTRNDMQNFIVLGDPAARAKMAS